MLWRRPDVLRLHSLSLERALRRALAFLAMSGLLLSVPLSAADNRTQLKPGIDRYSADEDVQIGRKVQREVERQLPILHDPRVDAYLNALGQRLAAHAPGPKFAYEFHCINLREVNAFALPGGIVYVYRGTIEAVSDEAQLAGVIAHEISHAALRHGTNQATKRQIWAALGAVGGAAAGAGGALAGIAAGLGGGLAADSVLLKYSRAAETQADILGTQILYDSGYDPRAMAQFFEQLETQKKGKHAVQFFADHPVPQHRLERVDEEVDKLGGPSADFVADTQAFRDIRRYLLALPPPPAQKGGAKAAMSESRASSGAASSPAASASAASPAKPPAPSVQVLDYSSEVFRLKYPDNWQQRGQGNSASFTPAGGIVPNGNGNAAYGVTVNVFPTQDAESLADATNRLIAGLQTSNPKMQPSGSPKPMHVDSENALSVRFTSESPRGGAETDWLVAVARPQGLLYFICIAPSSDFDDYNPTFQELIASVRLTR
jgi:beta-barrel assembly-enhancing protease